MEIGKHRYIINLSRGHRTPEKHRRNKLKNTGNAFIPTDYRRVFWSEKQAVEFGEHLEMCGAENVSLSQSRDPFNSKRTIYIIKWDE